MVTLSEIISKTSSNYFKHDNNSFLDLLAYFLRADCQCISLSCLYRNDKIDRIVIKTNSNINKDLEEVYENILEIIEYIKNLLNNFDSELNTKNSGLQLSTIYKDFIRKIMKYKFLQDPDFKKLSKENDDNKDDIKNNLSQVAPENWQNEDNNDDLSNLIKLRWEIFLKIIDDCKNVKFSMENIDNLFYLDANQEGEKTLNTELIHSELLVSDIMNCYYKKEDMQINFEKYYYIGSNFKNCPCCGIFINILNDINEIKIETNGCHLKYYNSWPFPHIMNYENINLLKKFFEKLIDNDNDNDDDVEFEIDKYSQYNDLKIQIEHEINEKAENNDNNNKIESTIDWNEIFQKRMNYLTENKYKTF